MLLNDRFKEAKALLFNIAISVVIYIRCSKCPVFQFFCERISKIVGQCFVKLWQNAVMYVFDSPRKLAAAAAAAADDDVTHGAGRS